MTTDRYFHIFKIKKISDISKKELKRRYRILVQKYHPDKPITGNAEKFKLIQTAYEYIQRCMKEYMDEQDKKFFNPNYFYYADGSIYDVKEKKWLRLKDEYNKWIIQKYKATKIDIKI